MMKTVVATLAASITVSSLIACSSPTDEEIESKSEEIAGRFMAALFSTTSSPECESIVDGFVDKWPEVEAMDPDNNANNRTKMAELKAVSDDLDDLEAKLDQSDCK